MILKKMKKIIGLLIVIGIIILIIFLIVNLTMKSKGSKIQKVDFITKDGVTIVADYYPNKYAKFAGIFVHMRPATKESYRELATFFQNQGFAILALDLRGHGESVNSVRGKLNYNLFSLDDEKQSINDLESASLFLEKEGFDKSKQFLIGASIGANLSYQFLAENSKVKSAVLLSPGINYHGVILNKVDQENFSQKILVIYALGDQPAVEASKYLRSWYPNLRYLEFQGSDHGTDLLEKYPQLSESILNWLREKLI